MPVNYQQIYTQIKYIGQGAKERRKKKEEAQASARNLLDLYASDLDYLRDKVDSAKAADANLRCALPLNESSLPPTPHLPPLKRPRSSPLTGRRSTQTVTPRSSFAWSMLARSK